jgi:hypothetical protein
MITVRHVSAPNDIYIYIYIERERERERRRMIERTMIPSLR